MALDIDITEDALYQLGEQKGEQKGREADALKMIKKGMATELISEITNLSAERIIQLGQQPEADA